jgi:hypothetical protein
MPKQGKKGKRSAASTKGNAKKKSKGSEDRGNVAGGSKLLDPQHNNGVAKQQLRNYMYDPVIPELDVACHRARSTSWGRTPTSSSWAGKAKQSSSSKRAASTTPTRLKNTASTK